MIGRRVRRRETSCPSRPQAARPTVEALEDRFLLSATTGGQWLKPQRITYSFVPDGTDIGGVSSNLQATLNARFATAAWKAQVANAAAAWQKVARVNLVQVPDDGSPVGVVGNQQSDPRFGDIRIGGYAQSSGQLGFAFLPQPYNSGTCAGDIFLNTTQSWQINGFTDYDLMTVMLHEFGHALGLDHSTDSTAAMWPAYNKILQDVTLDDTGGIRTIYNARQNDYFDANGTNNISFYADNISVYLNAAAQLTLTGLDSTPPAMIANGDPDWYRITVPAATSGTLVVKMQSSGLSVLSPSLAVYNATGTTLLGQQSSYAYGDTVSVTLTGVLPGQSYLIRAKGATTGNSGFGAYALQVNLGSSPLPAITPPNTTVALAADQGGVPSRGEAIVVGSLSGTGDTLRIEGYPGLDHTPEEASQETRLDHSGQGGSEVGPFATSLVIDPSLAATRPRIPAATDQGPIGLPVVDLARAWPRNRAVLQAIDRVVNDWRAWNLA